MTRQSSGARLTRRFGAMKGRGAMMSQMCGARTHRSSGASMEGKTTTPNIAHSRSWTLGFCRQALQLGHLGEEPQEVLVVNSLTSGAYLHLCSDAAAADLIAFDAEWAPDHSYGSDNPISVLQLAFPLSRRVYVLQLKRLENKLPREVQMMLVNPEVRKLGFAVDTNDRAKMRRSGIAITNESVTDVQELCAKALGVAGQSLSLKNAVFGLLGLKMDKDKRLSCSDWASKELTPQQVRYAALDAWVPLRLCYMLTG